MKKMLLLCSLLSMNLTFANPVEYLERAECMGEIMDEGVQVPITFTLMAEEAFFCSVASKPLKALILSSKDHVKSALEAVVTTTPDGMNHFSGSLFMPEIGRKVEVLKFDFTGTEKATLSIPVMGNDEVETYSFTCKILELQMDCLMTPTM